jgi:hypothetical protein
MKCVMCNRPLNLAAVSTQTRSGPKHWGPKCAKRAGLLAAVSRVVKAMDQPPTDPRQMRLEL